KGVTSRRRHRLHLELLEGRTCPSLLIGNAGVVRYNEMTGAFIDTFIPPGSGGLISAVRMSYGPDGDLYVDSGTGSPGNSGGIQILRFDGATGAFKNVVINAPTDYPYLDFVDFTFGPDGNIYTSTANPHSGEPTFLEKYNPVTGQLLQRVTLPRDI